ncbi:LOW QUALITY PROTEIN: RNA binding protein Jsn1 [Purpureocillium lavendulum]|uniref:RNA binding protein Jsn1 n=1 Tax=Purpureocillium lavendulum TaxID=1247861 RepID=A0AB34G634_9HYPO|nr:LOW QUALITY PROTEIN: RNA binding protein Jsn1 [Purpureocillium lavendulum]
MSISDQMAPGYSHHPSAAPQNHRSHSPSANNAPAPEGSVPSARSPFGLAHNGIMTGNSRSGAGSPSHDMAGSGRLFSKRAREIQAQEGIPGLPLNPWGGPPTSGNSTPLRENIPESPTDGFPDFGQLPTPDSLPQTRRARAGTVPSRFPPGIGTINPLLSIPGYAAKSARATPSQSPFKSPSPNLDHPDNTQGSSSALLSRLRAGSMPQRSPFSAVPGTSSPFGPSIFSSSWNPAAVGRERGSTLASIASVGSNGPSSPSHSQFSKEGGGESDVHMRTLDYLGLAETPQPPRAQLATPYMANNWQQTSRFRSYSVNNKDKYDKYAGEDDEEAYEVDGMAIDPRYAALIQQELAATNAAIHNHNLAVQAFANQASANRPRARTTGVLDAPPDHLRVYMGANAATPSALGTAEIRVPEEKEYDDLPQAIASMNLGRSNSRNNGLLSADEQGLEGPTSALWLGGVPTSTTTTTLVEMFKVHGPISSARVLTHKSCGFVNFERVDSAISAKASMNGKEIFPGSGPIRVNFAKPPSASNTPGHDGAYPSPSPDPHSRSQEAAQGAPNASVEPSRAVGASTPTVPPLRDMTGDILDIVGQFGASEDDKAQIAANVQDAIQYDTYVEEIPPIREPTHTRVHDAPKLRDIRKRIDNQLMSPADIENVAMEMLPEIAELSSDYLGNTVVQKLFEHCSDPVRDAMLAEIAPHIAEIGVHKNGTWAAQKIIDVCKTPEQMSTIIEHLRPYTVPLFLDQFGNYVLQGCLKFGAPFNEFIFEAMLSRMWEISQGRFGARAMRACLESHHATKNQQRMLAATIALHSVQLATNANGALLLTWFLDTCTFPQRRTVLSPRLVPYLVHLCTHKVAYLTVLKVINQKAEPDARDTILKALFFAPNDQVLEAILSDHQCGATLIFKVLTTPFFDESIRPQVVENVKSVLVKIKAQPNQGYKRVMDEVGLSTRPAGPNREPSSHAEPRQRPTSRQNNNTNGHHPQQAHANKPFYGPNHPSSNPPGFEGGYGLQRNDSSEAGMQGFQPYSQGMMYNAPTGPVPPAVNLQQMQYQQNMMARQTPQLNYSFPPMQPGYGAFTAPGAGVDQFRQPPMNGSPIQPSTSQVPQMPSNQTSYGPPGFGVPMGGGNYTYANMPGMQNMAYMQHEQGNGRRGRVCAL